MKFLRKFCPLVIGAVFFIAGLLKLMDPVGAGLVVEEYFKFLHIGFLRPAAKVTGAALAFVECALGAALITRVWSRVVAIASGVFLGFFTLLTLVLLIFNPSMDCGCFGEAVHLTHFQSFIKNVILCGLWAVAFLPLRPDAEVMKVKYVSFAVTVLSVALFALYSSLSIPLQDFTPYKPGAALEDTPMSFTDAYGQYCDSLATDGDALAVSVYDLDKLSSKEWMKVSALLSDAYAAGFETLLLVSGTPEQLESAVSDPSLLMSAYFAARRTLLTLNRSDGGATLISDGQIISKWSIRSLPDSGELLDIASKNPTETMLRNTSGDRLRLQAFLLYVFAVMLLL